MHVPPFSQTSGHAGTVEEKTNTQEISTYPNCNGNLSMNACVQNYNKSHSLIKYIFTYVGREVSSHPASVHHAYADAKRRRSVYISSGTTQVWVDTGAYRCVVLRGLLSCSSASFLQLVFSGVEAFAV